MVGIFCGRSRRPSSAGSKYRASGRYSEVGCSEVDTIDLVLRRVVPTTPHSLLAKTRRAAGEKDGTVACDWGEYLSRFFPYDKRSVLAQRDMERELNSFRIKYKFVRGVNPYNA